MTKFQGFRDFKMTTMGYKLNSTAIERRKFTKKVLDRDI
jgi:hypothetical protein